jgi:predicted ATPase
MTKEDLYNYINNKEYIEKQLEEYNNTLELLRYKKTIDKRLTNQYTKIFKKLIKQKERQNEILKILDSMENTTHRNILYNIYIYGMTPEECAGQMNYDYFVLQKKKSNALKNFENTKVDKKRQKKTKIFDKK